MFLGLSFDIAGGIALASGFISKRLGDVFRESRTYFGYNRPLLISALQQRGDAWAGASLLALGFGLQMFAYFHGLTTGTFGYVNSPARLGLLLLIVGPLAMVLVFACRRGSLRSLKRFEIALADPSAPPIEPIPGDPGHLDTIARQLGVSRLSGESDQAMADRLTIIRAENSARRKRRNS